MKKIAIFHNFLDNIGGAEIVTLTLAREFNAYVYTTNIDKEKITKMGYEDVLPRIHSIGMVPKNAPWRHQLAFWKFRRLNLGGKYDFYIISGDWAMSGAVNNKPNLWYVHSPLNELWAFKDYISKELLPFWQRPFFDLWVRWNRRLSLAYAGHVDIFVCNSMNTQKRLKKYYDVESEVIHPPIDTAQYRYSPHEGYWLSVNRLFKNKRVELQMDAFRMLPHEKLVIVGSYERGSKNFEKYRKEIESIKPPNVNIMSWIDTDNLRKLYSECKGFITTSRDEDFGMTAIEALASGKPVIASNEGGYRETVTEATGILIDDIDHQKLVGAIKSINSSLNLNPDTFSEACIEQARKFDTKIFVEKIKDIIYQDNIS